MKTNERANVINRPVFIYPGRNNEYDLKAIPADHTLITGLTGVGKTTMINQIVIQLIQQYSPDEVRIHIISGHGFNDIDWKVRKKGKVDSKRILPSIVYTGQTEVIDRDDYVPNVCDYIESIGKEHVRTVQEGYDIIGTDIVIIDDVILDKQSREQFKSVMQWSNTVKVIFAMQPYTWLDEKFIKLFRNRICLKSTEEVSEMMLGCNIASSRLLEDRYVAYYKRAGENNTIHKLWIPCTPISVINKIIGAFSVRLSNKSSKEA